MEDFKRLIDNSLLQKVAIVGGTMGIREIVEFVDLKCPCLEEYNVVYAWCSMLIPALVFFLMGLLPMRRMCGYSSYRYFASICGGTEGETTEHPFSSLSFSCEKGKRTECCYNLCSYLDTALVAPITWIIAVHLQGDLFICANATQNYTSLPCKDPEKEMLNEKQKNFLSESKARSQMIGWIFMAGAIALLVLSVFCNRCVDANIVINKNYMDAAYDALNDEFYKCKKKRAISELKKKLKKKRVRDRPAKHLGNRVAKSLGDHAAIPLLQHDPSITIGQEVGDLPAKHPGDRFAESLGDYAAIPLLQRDPSITSVRMVGDLPAKHLGDGYGQSFGDYAAIPLMERCRSMTSVRNDIPAAKVCSLASHSSGDIPAAKVCSPASHSSGDICARKVCSPASHSSGVEAATSHVPAYTSSSGAVGARRDIFPASHSFGVEAATSHVPAYTSSSGAVGARRDLFPASHSSGVEAATSDLPAYPPSFGTMGARRDLFPASHSFGAVGARRDLFPTSHSFGVERATSDLPADPPSSGDEDSEDTDEEWDNIVNLYKRA